MTLYMAGWLDSTIHDFLKDHKRLAESDTLQALITSLDSSDPTTLLNSALQVFEPYTTLGSGILLPAKQLFKITQRVFFGFDEVWFFFKTPTVPKPDSITIVGPNYIKIKDLKLADGWLRANNCSFGLGDGEGLNIVSEMMSW